MNLDKTRLAPWLVLLSALTVTLGTWRAVSRASAELAEARFGSRVDILCNLVVDRLEEHERLLSGCVGLFGSSPEVTPAIWRTYTEALHLDRAYPGVLGVGFAKRIRPEERDSFLRRMRADGRGNYEIWPAGERAEYFPIAFIEPSGGVNLRAPGFDTFSEPVRRAALERARDAGQATLSGKVILVQEGTNTGVQNGFMMYMPVYSQGRTPATVSERRSALLGYAYSAFRAGEFVDALKVSAPLSLRLRLYDGAVAAPDKLLYDSAASPRMEQPPQGFAPRFSQTRKLEYFGRTWTAAVQSLPSLENQQASVAPRLTLNAGLALSLLLGAMSFVQAGRKRAERALVEAKADLERRVQERTTELALIIERSPHSMWISDDRGTLIRTNQALRDSLGVTDEELVGKYNLLQDEVVQEQGLMPLVKAAFEEGKTVRFRMVYDSAKIKHVTLAQTRCVTLDITITPVLRADGKLSHTIVQHLDITELKRVEEALRHRTAELTALMDLAPVAIWVALDPQCRKIQGNRKANEIFQAQAGENVSPAVAPVRRFFHQGHEISPDDLPMQRAAATGRDFRDCEVDVLLPNGERKTLLGSASPLRTDTSQVRGCVGAFMDITERKRMEEQLRQTQKMEGIGHLAGGVAHEFNNLLAALIMNLNLARLCPLEPEAQLALQDMEGLCDRAAGLVRQILIFSHKSPMHLRPLDLAGALDGFTQMLRRLVGEHVLLEFTAAAALPSVRADQGMMEQALMNLCLNARDAMPQGGRLKVDLRAEDISEARARAHQHARPGRFICLSVTDTGSGMDARTQERIFEPFFTTKQVGQGTGLGLAVVHGIVQQHQGWIEVASQVGQGSTFRILLPSMDEPSARPEASAPPAQLHCGGGKTLLVVEDEASVRQALTRFLRRGGYQVLEASDGNEALRLWAQERQRIDLLFTDMVMPGGMTGLELTRRLRHDKPGLKVILSSGYYAEEMGPMAAEDRTITYLSKPCPPDKLLQALQTALDVASQ